MNSPEKTNLPGLEALRREVAPPDLTSRIRNAIEPNRPRVARVKVLKIGLATVVAGALVGTALLAPRTSLAAAVRKALQMIRRYHVKSHQSIGGKQTLVSEIWVTDGHRKFAIYGPDGKVMPESAAIGAMAEKIDAKIRTLTPKQLLEPGMKEKLLNDIAGSAPMPGGMTGPMPGGPMPGGMMPGGMMPGGMMGGGWTIDGKPVADLPEDMKNAIRSGSAIIIPAPQISPGGLNDITYLLGLLKDETIWDINPRQSLNGKTVDAYRIRGENQVTLYVDPKTSLPVRLVHKTTDLSGEEITMTDDFDYPTSGP